MTPEVGRHYVFSGVGVGVVKVEKPPPTLELSDLDGDRFEVDESEYDFLRMVVSEQEAEVLFERLTVAPASFSDDRESKRSLHYNEVFDNGTLEEQVEALRSIRHDPRDSPTEKQNRKRFEALVFGELAVALGVTAKTIRVRLANRVGAEPAAYDLLPDRSAELPEVNDIPAVANMRTLGSLYVEAEIGAGAEGVEQRLPASPGVWFAYGRSHEDPDDGAEKDRDPDPDVLLAVHAEHGASVLATGEQPLEPVGQRVPVEGATLCIADATAAGDRGFADRRMSLGGTGVFEGRAAQLSIGGDGSCRVEHVSVDGRAVVVRVTA